MVTSQISSGTPSWVIKDLNDFQDTNYWRENGDTPELLESHCSVLSLENLAGYRKGEVHMRHRFSKKVKGCKNGNDVTKSHGRFSIIGKTSALMDTNKQPRV